jgi:hypothetical protein
MGLGALNPRVDFIIGHVIVYTVAVTGDCVQSPFDYEPCDLADFLRYAETAAAAVPGLLPDGQQLFDLPLYTFK